MKLVSKNSTKQPKNAIINLCFGVNTVRTALFMLFQSYLVTFVYPLLNKYSQTKTMFLNFGLCLQVLFHIQYNQ